MRLVLSGNLKRFTNFESEIELDAGSVDGALSQLVQRFPSLRPVIFDAEGKLRAVHRLQVNGEVLGKGDTERQLAHGDELGILTAIAGG